MMLDWHVLGVPGVDDVMRRAAGKVSRDYSHTISEEDAYQEACIILASRPRTVHECLADENLGLGVVYHRLVCDLVDKVKAEGRRRTDLSSYDGLVEQYGEQADESVVEEVESPRAGTSGAYSRELVERLLPAVWDEEFAYGMRNPYTPDPDMPKGTIDKKASGTLNAHLADIRWAWQRARLERAERQALVLRFGMDLTLAEVGLRMGLSKSAAQRWVEEGVGSIHAWLNGSKCVSVGDSEETKAA